MRDAGASIASIAEHFQWSANQTRVMIWRGRHREQFNTYAREYAKVYRANQAETGKAVS